MSTINDLNLRNDVYQDEIPDELPEQGGSYVPQLPPGSYWFQLPANLAQLWESFDQVNDPVTKQPLAKPIQRLRLRFSKEAPLVVTAAADTALVGSVLVQSVSNAPRVRSKKADQPPVSDMTYLVRESLRDNSPLKSPQDWINVMNQHAGHHFPAEVGRTANCRNDKVRYITDPADPSKAIEDPTGQKGCGTRVYTQAFKAKDQQGHDIWIERVTCPKCGAALRGFAQIDRFLKNQGQQ